ncbi:MAG TPA: diacylglycerol kinase family lipid kinase [Nitrospirae bacterium]|nr:diacylglycerol kinase family lipid kinase [Nitrospirota bacterium]
MNASLVVNPVAGNKAFKFINKIETLLKKKASLTTCVTRKKGDAFSFSKEISDADIIITGGGDGTINEVINGMLSSEKNNQGNIPLALIPLGTTNVLARELGIPEEIERAVNLALTGTARGISLGRINGRYFSLMAGIGFDGETVLGVKNSMIKRISGKAAHIISGIGVMKRYDPPLIKIKTPEGEMSGYIAVAGNARCYGGDFHVTPHASVAEPLLDICVLKGGTRRALFRFITGVIRKRHLDLDDVSYSKASELEIRSDGKVHVQIDGDYFGTLPVKIDVVKDAVRVVRQGV